MSTQVLLELHDAWTQENLEHGREVLDEQGPITKIPFKTQSIGIDNFEGWADLLGRLGSHGRAERSVAIRQIGK